MLRVLSSVLNRGDYKNILSLVDSINHQEFEKYFILPISDIVLSSINSNRRNAKDFVMCFYNEIVSAFGYSPYLYFSDDSSPDNYNDIYYNKEKNSKLLDPIYIEIIIFHIKIYYDWIYNRYSDRINEIMGYFSQFKFHIKNNSSTKIDNISVSDIENSKLHILCGELEKVISDARDHMESLIKKFDDNWDEEF